MVKTVPPSGVHLLSDAAVSSLLTHPSQYLVPAHTLVTAYKYNSLNQVVWQQTPDGGVSQFWYDQLGRLAASQNAVQRAKQAYSYTLYDVQGRIVEVGEKLNPSVSLSASDASIHAQSDAPDIRQLEHLHLDYRIDRFTARNEFLLLPGFDSGNDDLLDFSFVTPYSDGAEFWAQFYASGTNSSVTRTSYDAPDVRLSPAASLVQQNLRKRVSSTSLWEQDASGGFADGLSMTHATHYSYDVAGNVHTLWQEQPSLGAIHALHRYKKLDYQFDLVSGKVNQHFYGWDVGVAFIVADDDKRHFGLPGQFVLGKVLLLPELYDTFSCVQHDLKAYPN